MTEQGTPEHAGGETTSLRAEVLTIPNVISGLRLLLVPIFAALLLADQDLWALGVLAVAGASDWLDGVLARRLGQWSRLGELLDPAADRLFILVTLVVLTLRDVVPLWLLVAIVGRDVLLSLVLSILTSRHLGPLPVHFAGKAGTFALLYAFPLLLLAQWEGGVGTVAGVVGWAFAWWGVGLYWLAAGIYLRQAIQELRRHRQVS
ncbi:CDP-alcohol phosphatidyltransferase family protein [Actinotalea soli]|uniref:CDP-alcohol phosphatidyltransferase family protein n=1 Tax=Actinotalea soli TaxID=2819234 RepID=UPI0027DC02CF|nr:CDP-alcohol phosphatidyltransferase family protein [Actinotalea soli]